ncbi:Hsp70 family protein [Nocardia arizonensis]|uniref:Hsp70 family protein n=1 Tax=Nocardia arizonensis TaxID=1141647 RepID=UPI0006CF3A7C|nr:Hsp70 family protein [Nocardia arizonensis]
MAVGLGLSIGTVNTVSAVAEEDSAKRPSRRRRDSRAPAMTRRTTLTFDSTGSARLGLIPRHGRAVTEFADLGRRGATCARVRNRALTPADLVALVADCLISEIRCERGLSDAGIALTHPAGYSEDQVHALRTALDGIGHDGVALIAEPVAAATWLESERGPLGPGLALVYDLGGASLDVTLVRVGAGRPHDPIVGTSLRSEEYGGRAFGAMAARRAAEGADPDALRAGHVRASLEVVYRCLRTADVTMADVGCVLVVGGAARPAEVARVLGAELARPVVIAADPERTVADGAAIMARRRAAAAEQERRPREPRLRRRLTRVAAAAGMSAVGVGIAVGVPADAVITAFGIG